MCLLEDGCRPNLIAAPPSWRLSAGWTPALHLILGQHRKRSGRDFCTRPSVRLVIQSANKETFDIQRDPIPDFDLQQRLKKERASFRLSGICPHSFQKGHLALRNYEFGRRL